MKSCERIYLLYVMVKVMLVEVNCQECVVDCICNIIKKLIIYIDCLFCNIKFWDGFYGYEKSKENDFLKKNLINCFVEGFLL